MLWAMDSATLWPNSGGDDGLADEQARYREALVAGHVAARQGRLDDALDAYRRAGELGAHRALPWARQGWVLHGLGRLEEALTAYQRALEVSPLEPFALAGRAAALASRTTVGLTERSARAAGRHERPAATAARRAVPLSPTVLLPIAYAIVLLVGEVLVTFVNPVLVFPLHGGLVVAVSLHLAWLARRPVETAESRALTALLLSFVVAPLIRIISLTLPLAQIEPAYRYFFAGVPMALGALLVARTLGLGGEQIGIVWRKPRLQALAVFGSLGLGLVEFTILRPAPLGALPWTLAGLLPAVAVGIFTGFPEEVIFRGLLQTTARPIMRSGTVLYAATVFAVLHIGYESATDLMFVFAVGLFYGWIFERSRSIVGVSIGHGLANVALFFVAPHLMSVLTGGLLY